MIHAFQKEIVQNPVIVGGKQVQWERVTSTMGILLVDDAHDPHLAAGLNALAQAQQGGVSLISAERAELLKKNKGSTASAQPSNRPRLFEPQIRLSPFPAARKAAAVPAASAVPPKPPAQPVFPTSKEPATGRAVPKQGQG